jgi:DNA-directed RNA polymerase specialized sigma24 family protein
MDWDTEFTEYVAIRWAALVRSAVLLGCNVHDAEDLVQRALSRCYVSWPKVRTADNRDAYVYRVLVNAHADSRRRRWWGEQPSPLLPGQADEADEAANVDLADAVERTRPKGNRRQVADHEHSRRNSVPRDGELSG